MPCLCKHYCAPEIDREGESPYSNAYCMKKQSGCWCRCSCQASLLHNDGGRCTALHGLMIKKIIMQLFKKKKKRRSFFLIVEFHNHKCCFFSEGFCCFSLDQSRLYFPSLGQTKTKKKNDNHFGLRCAIHLY